MSCAVWRDKKKSCTFFRHTQHTHTNAHTKTINTQSDNHLIPCYSCVCSCAHTHTGKSQLSCGSMLCTLQSHIHMHIGMFAPCYRSVIIIRKKKKCEIIWLFVKWTWLKLHYLKLYYIHIVNWSRRCSVECSNLNCNYTSM